MKKLLKTKKVWMVIATMMIMSVSFIGCNKDGDESSDDSLDDGQQIQISQVSAGADYTLFLTSQGNMYATGWLNIGNIATHDSPRFVTDDVKVIAGGRNHALILKNDGRLYAMGHNGDGRLGIGNTITQNSPQFVTDNVKAIAAGSIHSLILKNNGELYAAGSHANGALGIGFIPAGEGVNKSTPQFVTDNVKAIAARGHSLILKNNGELYAAGSNTLGQLGVGNTSYQPPVPQFVTNDVKDMAAGNSFSFILKNNGDLYATGQNELGQLGLGNTTNQSSPQFVTDNVKAIAAGGSHSVILKTDGKLYGSGRNDMGQLGLGNTTNQNSPQFITDNVKAITAGQNHSVILKTDGKVYATGWNLNGQLGLGHRGDAYSEFIEILSSSFKNDYGGGGCDFYAGPEFDIQIDGQCKAAFAYKCEGNEQGLRAACEIYKSWQQHQSGIPNCPYCD